MIKFKLFKVTIQRLFSTVVMLGICWVYAGYMLGICWVYAGYICWVYAGYMLGICWVYAGCGHMLCNMLGICWVYAGYMLGICVLCVYVCVDTWYL